jgi:hypothetical protein
MRIKPFKKRKKEKEKKSLKRKKNFSVVSYFLLSFSFNGTCIYLPSTLLISIDSKGERQARRVNISRRLDTRWKALENLFCLLSFFDLRSFIRSRLRRRRSFLSTLRAKIKRAGAGDSVSRIKDTDLPIRRCRFITFSSSLSSLLRIVPLPVFTANASSLRANVKRGGRRGHQPKSTKGVDAR